MRLQLAALCLLLALAGGLGVLCLRSTPFAPPSATTVQSAATMASPVPTLGNRPPVMTVNHAGQEQHGTLGSYCWNGCADAWVLLIPAQPITVPLGANIQFRMTERVAPHSLLVTLFSVATSQHMPFPDPDLVALGARDELDRAYLPPATEFEFSMPNRAGDYALVLWGVWQEPVVSSASASYGFRIVVDDSPPTRISVATLRARKTAEHGDTIGAQFSQSELAEFGMFEECR